MLVATLAPRPSLMCSLPRFHPKNMRASLAGVHSSARCGIMAAIGLPHGKKSATSIPEVQFRTAKKFGIKRHGHRKLTVRSIEMNQILRPTWDLLDRLVQSCQRELLICSPWLPASGLQKLRDTLTKSLRSKPLRSIQIWSRLSDLNTDSGLLIQIVEELKRAKIQVQLKDSPVLHAKIYLADRSAAIFGSCNLSTSGFEENLEIAALLSEPHEVQQICAVVDSIEREMQEVDLNNLAYFVEHQRPTMLQQQTTSPQIAVTPIWRQKVVVANREEKQTTAAPHDPRTARTSVTNAFSPLEVYHSGLELLDENQNQISRLDLRVLIGLKVNAV